MDLFKFAQTDFSGVDFRLFSSIVNLNVCDTSIWSIGYHHDLNRQICILIIRMWKIKSPVSQLNSDNSIWTELTGKAEKGRGQRREMRKLPVAGISCFIPFLKKIGSTSLQKSSEIFLCSVLHGSKERSPSVSRIFLLLVANAIVFYFRWCGDSAMCFVLLVVLLFSITARFGYIV